MTVHVNGSAAANGAGTGLEKPNAHPLDPLSAAEITAARDAVLRHFAEEASCDGKPPRFSFITLREPAPSINPASSAAPRRAEVVVHLPPTDPHELLVDVSAAATGDAAVLSARALPHGTQPVLTPADCDLAESIARADKRLQKLVSDRYGITDTARLVCDPWSVHLADGVARPDQRLVNTFLYVKAADGDPGEHNHYASPLHLTPTVDLVSQTVVRIHGEERAPAHDGDTYPSARVDYFDNALKYNSQGPTATRVHDPLRPLHVKQPDGPSFRLEGNVLTWQHWRLHIGFNHREGVVLNDVSFDGRSVLRRASLAEMAVPYADEHDPFPQKCAFDVGDYGLGYCANSLTNGCDCLGEIRYLDATLADATGKPYTVSNAVCVHEEDAGILHKHVEYRTGRSFVRRARKLVVSFIATVVNYEYLFYWWLHVDGSMGLDIRLSGELSTNTLSAGESDGQPMHGTLVAPGVNAQLHQHMFCARIDPAVDGAANRVVETNMHAATRTGESLGNGFEARSSVLETEGDAQRDAVAGRAWRIESAGRTNRVSGKRTAYKLVAGAMAGAQPPLLTHAESAVSRRARFAERAVWVTPWAEEERFPAGEFPTQGVDAMGLPEWTKQGRGVVDREIVVWHAFGITHSPRPEDFPIMPCETVGFTLKPDSFFETNPALDVCYAAEANGAAACHA